MSSVDGMAHLMVEVFEDECGAAGTTDPMVAVLKMTSNLMLQLGGAIPLIVNNQLDRDDWQAVLEDAVHKPLTPTELSKATAVLAGKRIRIFDSYFYKPPFITGQAEARCILSLEAGQFGTGVIEPDMSKAELYIFVEGWHHMTKYFADIDEFVLEILGRLRALIHGLVHGARSLQSLLNSKHALSWTRNRFQHWCLGTDQYRQCIATPPRLCDVAAGQKLGSDCPADAGRTWEHSISKGAAIFQRDLEVVVNANGRFVSVKLLAAEATEVLQDPRKLIEVSRRKACAIVKDWGLGVESIVNYTSCSGVVDQFLGFQCPGSSGWVINNYEEYCTLWTAQMECRAAKLELVRRARRA